MVTKKCINSNCVVGGGGAVEMAVSAALTEYARGISGKLQLVVMGLARALEVIPRQLCENAGFTSTEIMNQLRHVHHEKQCWMGVDIDKVVNLIVPDEAITRRMSGRRVCAKCGASYHIVNKPSAKEGVCDRCGGELAIRKDDEPATVLDRLKAYHEQTEPLVEFYRQRGKLVEVPDQGSIEATTAFLLKLLEA